MTAETILGVLSIVVMIAIPAFGYVVTSLRGHINGVSNASKERDEQRAREIRESEARCMGQIKDTEQRAEKGDERVLAHVNSQYSELNSQLRDIRDILLHRSASE